MRGCPSSVVASAIPASADDTDSACDEPPAGKPQRLKAKEIFVDVLWNGTWYKAEVLAKRGDKSLVHYEGFSTSYDEWVPADHIKLRGAPVPTPSKPAKPASATGFEGLFFRQAILPKDGAISGGQTLQTFPFWFLADGNVLGGSWPALGDYLGDGGLEAYKERQARFWGTYTIADGEIVITWTGGREERFALEGSPHGVKPKGLLRAYPLKRGLKLDGKYLGLVGGSSQGGNETTGTLTYVFRPDMTVTYVKEGLLSTVNRGLDGSETGRDSYRVGARLQGTYAIDGYRLTIKNEERNSIAPIWAHSAEEAESDAPKLIVITDTSYRLQE